MRNRPWSVLTVTFPPNVCVINTLAPAGSNTLSPAGMAVAGQSLASVQSWFMTSPQAQVKRQAGIQATRVVEFSQHFELLGNLVDQHSDWTAHRLLTTTTFKCFRKLL